ncbi:MAG: MBL fold metallo-hydrolase [Deltaproteobacteria bacterium]|nr:MBL fold metallo-hydrolase [Deltaproteobacteria bacterium]
MPPSLWDRLLGKRAHPAVPPGATFRRAVGLELRLRPCAGWQRVEVVATRHGGATRTELPFEEAAALARLHRWSTPDEAALPEKRLQELVLENLVFFSEGRPERDLGGAAERWDGLSVSPALVRHAWCTPVVSQARALGPIPFMPRVGTLADATLAGMHVGVGEVDRQVLGVGLSCCQAHGLLLRHVVAALNGRADVLGAVPHPDTAELLAVLGELGLLEQRGPPALGADEGTLTWLGHAAVLVALGGARVVVDPLFHPASHPARPGAGVPPDPRALPRVDAILVTHGDNDHFNPQALTRFPADTPLVLPAADTAHPWHVDLARVAALLGFTDVRFVRPWDRLRFRDLEVVATPFVGEDWGLPLPTVTWLLRGGGRTVYLGADTAPMPEVHARIGREFDVDLALLGVSGCQEALVMPPGFGYGNFYAPFLPRARRNEWTRMCSGPAESAAAAVLLKARRVFGYAAGGAPYISVAYTDRGTHAELAARLRELNAGPVPVDLPLGTPVQVTL